MNVALDLEIVSSALRRIAIGDRVALRTVYRLTSAKLFGICLRILGEQGDAEDVLQEVYVAVWQKAASFDPARASPMTWLIAIARNRAIHRLRASGQNRTWSRLIQPMNDPMPIKLSKRSKVQVSMIASAL